MVEFDTGNGEVVLAPSKLIEIVEYLETLQNPAPTPMCPEQYIYRVQHELACSRNDFKGSRDKQKSYFVHGLLNCK